MMMMMTMMMMMMMIEMRFEMYSSNECVSVVCLLVFSINLNVTKYMESVFSLVGTPTLQLQ
jgi:hypothetical protein